MVYKATSDIHVIKKMQLCYIEQWMFYCGKLCNIILKKSQLKVKKCVFLSTIVHAMQDGHQDAFIRYLK